MWAVRAERGDTLLPSGFVAEADGGWRHFVSSTRANPDQALFTAAVRYGDPFDRYVSRPFDSFDLGVDVSWPSTAWLTRVEIQGLLAGWDLDPGSLSAGGSWSWGKRISTYDAFDTIRVDATQWRAFVSCMFR